MGRPTRSEAKSRITTGAPSQTARRSLKAALLASTNSATTGYTLFNMHALLASTRELGATSLGELLTDKSAELRERG